MDPQPRSAYLLCLLMSLQVCGRDGRNGDLVINVGFEPIVSGGYDREPKALYKQVISGNSSTDAVTLEYEEPDGTTVTQLTDFRTRSQIVRVISLGEEEVGEPLYQVQCFVSAFTGDFIPPEAVMKLRQKHPEAVRVAEKDEGEFVQDSRLLLRFTRSSGYLVSSHLSQLCKDAKSSTFTSSYELLRILNINEYAQDSDEKIRSLTRSFQSYDALPRCSSLPSKDSSRPNGVCLCTRKVWVNWYPCLLKYCRNKDGESEHRCGIKTCKKCLIFRYPVGTKRSCNWDES